MRNTTLMLITTLAILAGCRKDDPKVDPPPTAGPPSGQPQGKRIFILNEGGFNVGKGNVSAYYPSSGLVTADFYEKQNSGETAGDVAFSMIRHNDEYFIVVNNSQKIIICDPDLKKKGEITGLPSPRYILPIVGDIAYISDLTGGITVMNLATRSVIKKISLPGFTEEMALFSNEVYVTNASSKYMYRIEPNTHQITDSIEVGPGGACVAADKEGKLWVLASGDYLTQTPGRLSRINPVTWSVERALDFSASAYASEMRLSPGKDTLYFLESGVRRMAIGDSVLPASPFISAGTMSFYALELNHAANQLYVSDVVDYVQRSTIMVYNAKGQSVTSFKAGVISTDFYFE